MQQTVHIVFQSINKIYIIFEYISILKDIVEKRLTQYVNKQNKIRFVFLLILNKLLIKIN